MKYGVAATLAAVLCSGCMTYNPLSLISGAALPDRVPRITIDASRMPFPELAAHRFDPADGLDAIEVEMLAVVNNPDLRVARDEAHITRAQSFAAGLLPDPQLSASIDRPTSSEPGLKTAYTFGIAEDIVSVLTYSSRRAAGRAQARSADLKLLWQEWQVATQSRLLFVKLTQGGRILAVLEESRRLFADRYARTRIALDRGLLTLDAVTPNLTALQDMNKQIHDVERQINQTRHDLNALLGLAPEVFFPLVGNADLPPIDERAILAMLPRLPLRRPDLIALRYGYEAQDRTYRAAILTQFPNFTLGFTRARDTSGIGTFGLGVTLSLPFFDGSRGRIRVEEATRKRLFDDYEVRVNKATSDVRRLLDEQRINARQLDEVDRALVELADAAAKANAAFAARSIDALAFAALQSSLLSKQIERITLEQAILEQRAALQTLIGAPLPETAQP